MSSPPIAKEPEVTGLREKLEEIAALDYTKAAVNLAAYNAVHLAHEAIALLESEQGKQMRRDHEAMEILRGNLGAGHRPISLRLLIDGQWKATNSARIHHADDPTDAILGTENEEAS